MKYKKAKKLKDKDFKRFYGVCHETFQLICQEVKEIKNQKTSGRHSDLSVEDQVLLALSYWREYRTMFHLGQDYGLHKSMYQELSKRSKTF
jgi:hypothetical protein